jgi:hypothetical protein
MGASCGASKKIAEMIDGAKPSKTALDSAKELMKL